MLDLFVVEIQQQSLRLDSDTIMESLTDFNSLLNSLYSFSYYIKGNIFTNIIAKYNLPTF